MIRTEELTKDYGFGRGVFDVSVNVREGECFGFLGPNGAGKTTLIRHLMGFSRPDRGYAEIDGMECFGHAAELERRIGYLPGEIALPRGMSGTRFLNMMMKMRGVTDDSYLKMLLERFELDADVDTKRMSLGVKRKTAVVAAFLHDPDILILDEPTSGLDPVMQQKFIEFVKREKERGKTIFFSSHIFHEIDECCDRIAIIKDGHVVSLFTADELRNRPEKIYRITFADMESYQSFKEKGYSVTSESPDKIRLRIKIDAADVNRLLGDLASLRVADFIEIQYTLEDHFMSFYRGEHDFEGVS